MNKLLREVLDLLKSMSIFYEQKFIDFSKDHQGRPNITNEDMMDLYDDCIYHIFNIKCLPLINNAKRTNLYHTSKIKKA